MERSNKQPANIEATPVRAIILYEVQSDGQRDYFGTIENIVDGNFSRRVLLNDHDIINLQKILNAIIAENRPEEGGFVGLIPYGLLAVKITPTTNDFCFVMEPMQVTLNLNGKQDSGWFPRTLWTVSGRSVSVHCLAEPKEDLKQPIYNFPMPHNNSVNMCTGTVNIGTLKTVRHIDDAMYRVVKGILEAKISHVMVKDFETRWNNSKKTRKFSVKGLQKTEHTLKQFLVWQGFTT